MASVPTEYTRSVEADIAFLREVPRTPDEASDADQVDGAIGEGSRFHSKYGYYGQGVSIETAVLPVGWRSRAKSSIGEVGMPNRSAQKLTTCALRNWLPDAEKDFEFVRALIEAAVVDHATLLERSNEIDQPRAVVRRLNRWIDTAIPR